MKADSVPDAASLRAMGIEHELLSDDSELVAIVRFLASLGVSLEEMIDEDLTYMAGPRLIRPDATLTPEAAFGADHDADFARRSSLALGFNVEDDPFPYLTPGEVDAIRYFESVRPIFGEEDLLALLRVMGTSMGRLARSVVSSLRLNHEAPLLVETGSLVDVARSYQQITEDLLPPFLDAMATVYRRHLAIVTSQQTIWNVDGLNTATMEVATVGFVDLVGFTSFTEQANLQEFVQALTAFEAQVQEVVVANGGTLVKLIGDEAMFVAPTPAAGVEIARRLARLTLAETGPASVRIGLATGEVVAIGGDYYGTVVNIASRAVQEADPDTIVVTAEVASGAHASTRFEDIGARELRGISEPTALFRLV